MVLARVNKCENRRDLSRKKENLIDMKKEAAKAMEYLAQLKANEQYQNEREAASASGIVGGDVSLLTASVGSVAGGPI